MALNIVKSVEVLQQRQSSSTDTSAGKKHTVVNHLVFGLVTAGAIAIAPPAFCQGTTSPPDISTAASVPTASPHLLSAEQMEQLSNVLLGLIYFVLPAGLGLGLFLHDRYQNYRAATIEAQIKLLEKLWEQSPQA